MSIDEIPRWKSGCSRILAAAYTFLNKPRCQTVAMTITITT